MPGRLLIQDPELGSDAPAFTAIQPLQQAINFIIDLRIYLRNELLLLLRWAAVGSASRRRPN